MLVISLVVYAISFVLLRLLSRYRELCADRSGAYLTQKPAALASALTKVSGQMNAVPERDLRAAQPMNALFLAPAIRGLSLGTLTATHPPLEQRLDQLAKIAASLGQTAVTILLRMGLWDVLRGQSKPRKANLDALFAVPSAAITLEASLGLHADRQRCRLLPGGRGPRRQPHPAGGVRPRVGRRRPAHREPGRRVRLHLAHHPHRPARRRLPWSPTCTP